MSASGLAQPKRAKTSLVVSWMQVPGLWNSRVAFARTLTRRKRFETWVIAPKTRSERMSPSGRIRDLLPSSITLMHSQCQSSLERFICSFISIYVFYWWGYLSWPYSSSGTRVELSTHCASRRHMDPPSPGDFLGGVPFGMDLSMSLGLFSGAVATTENAAPWGQCAEGFICGFHRRVPELP